MHSFRGYEKLTDTSNKILNGVVKLAHSKTNLNWKYSILNGFASTKKCRYIF